MERRAVKVKIINKARIEFDSTSYEYGDDFFVVTEDPLMLTSEKSTFEAKSYTFFPLNNVEYIKVDK